MTAAVCVAGLTKRSRSHALRHTVATHLLEVGYDLRTVQAPLGHRGVRTTRLSTHVFGAGGLAIHSPADRRRPGRHWPESRDAAIGRRVSRETRGITAGRSSHPRLA